jgi:hypothetical protein
MRVFVGKVTLINTRWVYYEEDSVPSQGVY